MQHQLQLDVALAPAATPAPPSASPHLLEGAYTMPSLAVKNPALLRGMPVKHILHRFSCVLSSSNGSEDHYKLSEPVEYLDAFLSHTWNTPRFQKFLLLAFHYNLVASLAISLVVGGVCAVLTARGVLPSVALVGLVTEVGRPMHRGLLCVPAGMLSFFVSLFTLHEFKKHFIPKTRERRIFLDKCCIHQTDPELKREGIASLAAFLQVSRELLVVYSGDYLGRLWTTYEVASWLVLRRGEPMTVRPVFAPKALLGGCLTFTGMTVVWFLEAWLKQACPQIGSVSVMWTALSVLPYFQVATVGRAWAADLGSMEAQARGFRLAEAKCFCEADRDLVAMNIASFMRTAALVEPSAPLPAVILKFEEMVRQDVPALIKGSLGRVGIPYSWLLVLTLPNAMTCLDWAAGWSMDERSGSFMFWTALKYMQLCFVVFPLICAFVVSVFRVCPILQRREGCLFIGAVGCLAWYAAMHTFSYVAVAGVSEQVHHATLVLLHAIGVGAAIATFRLT